MQIKFFIESIQEISAERHFNFSPGLVILVMDIYALHIFDFNVIQLASELVISDAICFDLNDLFKAAW